MSVTESLQETSRLIEFRLGKQLYAIPLLKVREVIPPPKTTAIPKAPEYFEGVTNLRGQIIVIVDIRSKLGIPASESSGEDAAMIIDMPNARIGILVDSINKVLHIKDSELKKIKSGETENSHPYIINVINKKESEELVIVIDIEKALDNSDLKILEDEKQTA